MFRASSRTARMWRCKVVGRAGGGAAMNVAGMVPELNPVPLGRCRGPWRERQHQTVPTSARSAEAFLVFA